MSLQRLPGDRFGHVRWRHRRAIVEGDRPAHEPTGALPSALSRRLRLLEQTGLVIDGQGTRSLNRLHDE